MRRAKRVKAPKRNEIRRVDLLSRVDPLKHSLSTELNNPTVQISMARHILPFLSCSLMCTKCVIF